LGFASSCSLRWGDWKFYCRIMLGILDLPICSYAKLKTISSRAFSAPPL
jgi:hypothetical protein